MTVHMVRLFVEPPKGEAETAVNNWVQNHNEWKNDSVEHSLTETTVGIDGTTYIRGDYRFIQEETPTDLLDDLESRLQSIQGGLWYRLGYHVCDHHPLDEPNTPCEWDKSKTRESDATVPSDIPAFA